MLFGEQPFEKVYVGPRLSFSWTIKLLLLVANILAALFLSSVACSFFIGCETKASRVSFVDDTLHELSYNYTLIDSTHIELSAPDGELLKVPVRYHSHLFGFTSDFVELDRLPSVDQTLTISARKQYPYRCNSTVGQDCAVFISRAAYNGTMVSSEPTVRIIPGTGEFPLTEYSVIIACLVALVIYATVFTFLGKVISISIEHCFERDLQVRVYEGAGFYRGLY